MLTLQIQALKTRGESVQGDYEPMKRWEKISYDPTGILRKNMEFSGKHPLTQKKECDPRLAALERLKLGLKQGLGLCV